jgi:hypothetical protein
VKRLVLLISRLPGNAVIFQQLCKTFGKEGQTVITICHANGELSQTQYAMAESEGRWPRICALAHKTERRSEVGHVL